MTKKANAIICAICTLFAIVIITGLSTTLSAQAEPAISVSSFTDMVKAEDGKIFLVGDAEESEFPKISEVVKSVKYELLISSILEDTDSKVDITITARNNKEMKVTDSSRYEFINQYGYCDPQTITVYEDIISTKTKLMIERPLEDGGVWYCIYNFDKMCTYEEAEKVDDSVLIFNYLGFRYNIFVQNNQFCIAKKWDPIPNTRVYDCCAENEVELDALKRKLSQAFNEGTEITFLEEEGYFVRIHAFVNNHGETEEYIFYTYNARPLSEESEVIASVKTYDDDYMIYVEDGFVCLDSAKRTSYINHLNVTKEV